MDQKQKEYFKTALLEIKDKITNDIKTMTSAHTANDKDAAENIPGHGLHMADFATDMYDREFNLGLASNDRELLQTIDKALKRLEDKSFGVCTHCKKPIAAVRLKAIPYVETCLKCQEQLESKKR